MFTSVKDLTNHSSDSYVFSHESKERIRHGINVMLESLGYVISTSTGKRFERMPKKTLNELYNMLRYGMTNSEHLPNDLHMCYGLILVED